MDFGHARNSGLKEIHRILRCPVELVQATVCWVLPRSVIGLPILSEDSRLLHSWRRMLTIYLGKGRPWGGLQGILENQLVGALANGRAQAAEIANQLGMSVRSLRRRLAGEDATFGEILAQVKHHLALRYLEDERVFLSRLPCSSAIR